ncbi:MAG: hypothetical protein JNJ54_15200 [Myxococcaceae bacterium]|nr:hypothetical protein [Myxococcaceae bacterium]
MTPVPPELGPNPMAAPPPGGGKSYGAVIAVGAAAVAALCCIASVVAIALPSYSRFGARSKQSEVKSNLKAAYVAERSWFAEHEAWSTDVDAVGFSPVGGRYLYAFSVEGKRRPGGSTRTAGGPFTGVEAAPNHLPVFSNDELEDAVDEALWREVGLSGECPKCDLTVLGVGDLDGDPTVDVWTISTKERIIDGVTVPAGQPYNHVDDTRL